MKDKLITIVLSLIILITPFIYIDSASAKQVNITREDVLQVAKELHPPGCTDSMTADYCTLSTAYETRAEIWDLLQQGYDKQEIINMLVNKYGERILASPVKEGFHLLAWVLPGLSILIGATIILFSVRKWLPKKSSYEGVFEYQGISLDDEKRVQNELKNWL